MQDKINISILAHKSTIYFRCDGETNIGVYNMQLIITYTSP